MTAFEQFLCFCTVGALLLVAGASSATQIAWDPSPDNAVVGYFVHYGPTSRGYTVSVDVGAATSHNVTSLPPGQTNYFAVTAYDAGRAQSAYSNEVQATEPTGGPIAALSASTTSGAAPLALNFTSASTGSITSYSWTFGDGTSSSSPNPSKLYASPGVYTVTLRVTGPGGTNTQVRSNYITVTGPGDTTPPGIPPNPVATGISNNSIRVLWSPATDNVGVVGYQVDRCLASSCATWTLIATPSGTAYTDPGLATATTYRYRIRAVDAAGNFGSYSPFVVATTMALSDTSPPTSPGRPVAVLKGTTVTVRWGAATDNVGIGGYRLERCEGVGCTTFAEISAPFSTTVEDAGRSPAATYRYRVRAVDTSGNMGPYSSVMTLAMPGTSDSFAFGQVQYAPAKSLQDAADLIER